MELIKIMSATRPEFLRSLKHFAQEMVLDETSSQFSFPIDQGEAHISIKSLPEKAITSLMRLPQLEVRLAFHGINKQAAEKFIEDFDQAFRRGGG